MGKLCGLFFNSHDSDFVHHIADMELKDAVRNDNFNGKGDVDRQERAGPGV